MAVSNPVPVLKPKPTVPEPELKPEPNPELEFVPNNYKPGP